MWLPERFNQRGITNMNMADIVPHSGAPNTTMTGNERIHLTLLPDTRYNVTSYVVALPS